MGTGLDVIGGDSLCSGFAGDVVSVHVHVAGFQTGNGRVGIRLTDDHDRVEPAAGAGGLFRINSFNFDNAGNFDFNRRGGHFDLDDLRLTLDDLSLGDDAGNFDDGLPATGGEDATYQYQQGNECPCFLRHVRLSSSNDSQVFVPACTRLRNRAGLFRRLPNSIYKFEIGSNLHLVLISWFTLDRGTTSSCFPFRCSCLKHKNATFARASARVVVAFYFRGTIYNQCRDRQCHYI